MCSPAQTEAVWGGHLRITWYTDPADQAGADFTVRADAAAIAGITVQTPQGFAVGDSIAAMASGTPNATVEDSGGQVFYDLDANHKGALAQGQEFGGGPILFLYAPAYINQDC